MVYFMENPIKMDDLGGPPLFLETPIPKILLFEDGIGTQTILFDREGWGDS